MHAVYILRGCFFPDQDYLVSIIVPCFCIICSKHYPPCCSAWTSRESFCKQHCLLLRLAVQHGMKQFIQLIRLYTHERCLFIDHPFLCHINSHFNGCRSISFPDPGLEHPKPPFLDCKLYILHIGIMVFKCFANLC